MILFLEIGQSLGLCLIVCVRLIFFVRLCIRFVGLFQDNVASSSRSNVRFFFTEMGYPPPLVDRVIEENGIWTSTLFCNVC